MTKDEQFVVETIIATCEHTITELSDILEEGSFYDAAEQIQRLHYWSGLMCTWASTHNYMRDPKEYLIDMQVFHVMEENDDTE